MTSANHKSGTDRVEEAVNKIKKTRKPMKKIVLGGLAALTLAACSQKGFQVKTSIDGLEEGQTLYLSVLHGKLPQVIDSVSQLKKKIYKNKGVSLDLGETLTALSVSVPTNPAAQLAMKKLSRLAGCEMHISHLPTPGDEVGLRKLGIHLTSEPRFTSRNLFLE